MTEASPKSCIIADTASSAFSHDSEQAEPGYYAVQLDDSGVQVELTAGARAAIHRYTFDAAGPAHIYFDLGQLTTGATLSW